MYRLPELHESCRAILPSTDQPLESARAVRDIVIGLFSIACVMVILLSDL